MHVLGPQAASPETRVGRPELQVHYGCLLCLVSEGFPGGQSGHSQSTCMQLGAWSGPGRQRLHLAMITWALLLLPPLPGLAALSWDLWLATLEQPHHLMVLVAQYSGQEKRGLLCAAGLEAPAWPTLAIHRHVPRSLGTRLPASPWPTGPSAVQAGSIRIVAQLVNPFHKLTLCIVVLLWDKSHSQQPWRPRCQWDHTSPMPPSLLRLTGPAVHTCHCLGSLAILPCQDCALLLTSIHYPFLL